MPESKLTLRDAIALLGEAQIAEWDGSEISARPNMSAPEPPWLHHRVGPLDCFVIDDDGNPQSVPDEIAWDWWYSIETDLISDWKLETEASNRWQLASNKLRNLLADAKLVATLLTDTGNLFPIESNKWLGEDAAQFLRTGLGAVDWTYGIGLATYEGAILIERSDLIQIVSGELGSPSGPDAALDFDLALFPYLAFMIHAARGGVISSSGRTPKKAITAWLKDHWPDKLGEPTRTKIETMATFLRRPEDETGGILKQKPNKEPDH